MNKSVESQHYTSDFYNQIQNRSKRSAQIVLPYIFEYFKPTSVIDIGCGTGDWLSVFKEFGVKEIHGVDGEYVDKNMLQIDNSEFKSFDLKYKYDSGRKYDLAMSVEVGEHLPDELSDNLIDSLCVHSDIILFSAAIPGQGGTYHINEQPHSYWIEKFNKRGYDVYDVLREKIWFEPYVEAWYKQNILLFLKPKALTNLSVKIREGYNDTLPKVHEELCLANSNSSGLLISFIKYPTYTFRKYINILKSKAK